MFVLFVILKCNRFLTCIVGSRILPIMLLVAGLVDRWFNHLAYVTGVSLHMLCTLARCAFKFDVYVARVTLYFNVLLLGKMRFQTATGFAFALAHVARHPFNVDIMLLGKMLF